MNIYERRLLNCLYIYKVFSVLVIFGILFFQVALNKTSPIPNYIDEAILAGILGYSILKAFTDEVIKKVLTIYVATFLLLFLLSVHSVSSRGLLTVLLQIFIHLKYIIFFSFAWMSFGHKHSFKLALLFLFITVIFLFFNIFTGSYFNEVFDLPLQLRAGNVRPVGIQADTASLGTTFALIGCLLISGVHQLSAKLKVLLLIVFSILVLLSTVRTALVLIPLIILWWLKDSMKSFFIALIIIVALIIPMKSSNYFEQLVDITTQNIEWTVDNPVESGYIRGIMLYFSFELALDRFPIGTGAATFGTVMSDDSLIYAEIGLQNSRFFVEKEGIYDSNFASLLGEFGVVGIFIYYLALYLVILTPLKTGEYVNEREFRFVFFLLLCAYSVATPIFMNTYPALMLSVVLVSSYRINLTSKDQHTLVVS